MRRDEAEQVAQIIVTIIPHNNVDLLCVFGEVKTHPITRGGLKPPDAKYSWSLTDAVSGAKRRVPCIENDLTLVGNARNIASAFDLTPEQTTVCLIQDSLDGLADITAAVPNPNSSAYKRVAFGINNQGEILKKRLDNA